jgi:hypothetical protein
MRKYQPIWIALKTSPKKTISISAPAPMHKRISKAVLKEKDLDLGFRFEASLEGRWYRISYSSNHNILEFKLKNERITLEDL